VYTYKVIVLVVDDLRLFGDEFNGCIVHYATNSADALAFLNDETNFGMLSEIWLDHDLGLNDTIDPVLNWLEEKAYNKKCNHINAIRILTNNPVGMTKIAWLGKYFYIAPTPKHIGLREINSE
jgi:hypothetical protein